MTSTSPERKAASPRLKTSRAICIKIVFEVIELLRRICLHHLFVCGVLIGIAVEITDWMVSFNHSDEHSGFSSTAADAEAIWPTDRFTRFLVHFDQGQRIDGRHNQRDKANCTNLPIKVHCVIKGQVVKSNLILIPVRLTWLLMFAFPSEAP